MLAPEYSFILLIVFIEEGVLENMGRVDQNEGQPVDSVAAASGEGAFFNNDQRRIWRKPAVRCYDALTARTGVVSGTDGNGSS